MARHRKSGKTGNRTRTVNRTRKVRRLKGGGKQVCRCRTVRKK